MSTFRDADEILATLRRLGADDRLIHEVVQPAREGATTPWPNWVSPGLRAAYAAQGISTPWQHQAEAAEAAWQGRHTVVATGTGSGKSLAAWLPVLQTALDTQTPGASDGVSRTSNEAARTTGPIGRASIAAYRRRPTALYLAPTKALAADQLASLQDTISRLPAPVRATRCDGDSDRSERDFARAHADIVASNLDFLHASLLPGHERWARLLRGLRFVVLDEMHAYRGVHGAHASLVLRRLLRLARHLGADSTVIALSATTAQPRHTLARLVGAHPDDVAAITDDASPSGRRHLLLWQPRLLDAFAVQDASSGDAAVHDEPGTRAGDTAPTAAGPGGRRGSSASDAPTPADASVPADASLPAADAPEEATSEAQEPVLRRAATVEAADLLTDLVMGGARTLTFVRSRFAAESVAVMARERLAEVAEELPQRVATYRGGYLPEERRELERALRSGDLLGLATTSALELGIDVAGLDCVLITGWPGTRASMRQQSGRAGRAGQDGVAVLIASENPLDNYLVHHPEAILDAPVEATTFDPANPYVLGPHICAAASELPLRAEDLPLFGLPDTGFLESLAERDLLRRRPTGWYWNVTLPMRPQDLTSLRGSTGATVSIVDKHTGTVLGTVDGSRADATVHPGAIYLHQGRRWFVHDLVEDVALVEEAPDANFTTRAFTASAVEIRSVRAQGGGAVGWAAARESATPGRQATSDRAATPGRQATSDPDAPRSTAAASGTMTWGFGEVDVTSQVTQFERRRRPGGDVLSVVPLEMPVHVLPTTAVWWTFDEDAVAASGLGKARLPGALHAMEHAAIGMLPLLATCDRWDLGGLSTALHADTGAATVFVHDAHPGGAGFAERGFGVLGDWWRATLDVIASCRCREGCPGCVQSPKCGNGNNPLDKDGAATLLRTALSALPD